MVAACDLSRYRSSFRPTIAATFGIDPLTKIRGAVRQSDTIRLAAGQKRHSLPIDQSDVPQIKPEGFPIRFLTHHALDLGDVPGFDVAAEQENDSLLGGPLNHYHVCPFTVLD
jgi:hypothetical protein